MQSELKQMQIYSLPTYDYKTDTFKDGPLPKNVDSYFSKSKEAQTYYSWATCNQNFVEDEKGASIYLSKNHSLLDYLNQLQVQYKL